MNTDNIATAQSVYAAFGAGDIATIHGLLAADVEWDVDGQSWGIPWYEPRHGADDVLNFFPALMENAELTRFEPLNFLGGGNQVAVVVDVTLKVLATGKSTDELEIHLWTFDDHGKISRFGHVIDRHGTWLAMQP